MNNRLVGQMDKAPSGAIAFTYDPQWLAWEGALPISLSLPLRKTRYAGESVVAVFENLLPDSRPIRTRVAGRVGARGTDAYSLLARIGRDCVGALQFLPADESPVISTGIEGVPVNEAAIEGLLANLEQAPLGSTPTTHLLKPQIGDIHTAGGVIDLSNSVENELYCLGLLRAFGLETARAEIHTFGRRKALVIERFDRRWTTDGRLIRLPQEDCCQALSVPPSAKYQSEGGPGVGEIIALLQGSDDPARDRLAFFKSQLLFWLMGATDGHAKNFSLFLRPGGRFALAPFYDVLTAQPSLDARQLHWNSFRLAMAVGNRRHYRIREVEPRHFVETGLAAGLPAALVRQAIDEIRDNAAAMSLVEQDLPPRFPQALHASVNAALIKRVRELEKLDLN